MPGAISTLPLISSISAVTLLLLRKSVRKARLQGIVILEAIITKDGNVESVRVLRGINPLLDNAAMRAVQQWKYKPATFNGRPVPVYLTVTVTFKLQ